MKEASTPDQLAEFLADRVVYWADKCESAVNAADLRNCRNEAHLALMLYRMVVPKKRG